MAENPDRQDETASEFQPFVGALRWLDHGVHKTLQQYQYSATDDGQDWYDVPVIMATPQQPVDYATPEETVDKLVEEHL